MKKALLFGGLLAVAAAGAWWVWGRGAPRDLPVAEVNGEAIPASAFNRLLAAATRTSTPGGRVPGPAEKARLLAQMVDAAVLRQEAAARGLAVTDTEVEAELASVRGAASAEGESAGGLKGDSPEGLEGWRDDLRDRLLFLKLAASEATPVTEEEVAAYFEANPIEFDRPPQARARQIVVKEQEQAEELRRRAQAGEPFAELARSHSIAPEAAGGGELGTFSQGTMPGEIDSAVFVLPAGGLSPVVRSPYGWHVIYVEERLPARKLTLEDARAEIGARLARERQEQVLSRLLPALRQKAAIVLHPENLSPENPAHDER